MEIFINKEGSISLAQNQNYEEIVLVLHPEEALAAAEALREVAETALAQSKEGKVDA